MDLFMYGVTSVSFMKLSVSGVIYIYEGFID